MEYQPSMTEASTPPPRQGTRLDDDAGEEDDDDVIPDEEESEPGVATSPPGDPNCVEERFRVDRRKLEQLILASSNENDGNSAEDFFLKIMKETSTEIAWPSKLKIGARSKKDPYVKVSGLKENITVARERIMMILDTKSHRVTLKMEVSHTDHSHIIGKGGGHIKNVMQETDCHIHFPDSNRKGLVEKSNQVSIAGTVLAVESARSRIRDLLPLVLLFELPCVGPSAAGPGGGGPLTDPSSSPAVQQIQQRYNVCVVVRQHRHVYVRTVIVRGSVHNAAQVRDATVALFELMTGSASTSFTVSLLVDIAPLHHMFVIGPSGANVRGIMARTETTIHFPDPATVVPNRRCTVYITGTIGNVLAARRQLLGCLPVVLMFDVHEEIEVDPDQVTRLMERLGLSISVRPKQKQPHKTVMVKGVEMNVLNMYETRRLLANGGATPGDCKQGMIAPTMTQPFYGRKDPGMYFEDASVQQYAHMGHVMMRGGVFRPVLAPPTMLPLPPCGVYRPIAMVPQFHHFQLPPAHSPANQILPNGSAVYSLDVNHLGPAHRSPSGSAQKSPSGSAHRSPQLSPASSSGRTDASVPPRHNPDGARRGLLLSSAHMENPCVDERASDDIIDSLANLVNSLSTTSLIRSGLTESGSAGGEGAQNSTGFDTSALYRLLLQNACLAPTQLSDISGEGSKRIQSSLSAPSLSDQATSTLFDDRDTLSSDEAGLGNTRGASSVMDGNGSLPNVSRFFGGTAGLQIEGGGSGGEQSASLLCHQLGQLGWASSSAERREGEVKRPIMCMPPGLDAHADFQACSELNKAPGFSRPKKHSSSFADDPTFDMEYEQKKLLANKAMQGKPMGETRTPTDFWSGLGFSRSMPEAAIRSRLTQHNTRFNGALRMETTFEDAEGDGDDDLRGQYMWGGEIVPSPDDATLPGALSGGGEGQLGAGAMDLAFSGALSTDSGFGEAAVAVEPMSDMSSIWESDGRQPIGCLLDPTAPPSDLAELFSQLGLGKYTDLFQQQEIDLATFRTLTEQDLRELGISTFGARRKMLLAIADLNKRRTFLAPPPGLPNPFRASAPLRRPDFSSQSGRW